VSKATIIPHLILKKLFDTYSLWNNVPVYQEGHVEQTPWDLEDDFIIGPRSVKYRELGFYRRRCDVSITVFLILGEVGPPGFEPGTNRFLNAYALMSLAL
jgi:hypothetical protein